jgi:hypothetical protein
MSFRSKKDESRLLILLSINLLASSNSATFTSATRSGLNAAAFRAYARELAFLCVRWQLGVELQANPTIPANAYLLALTLDIFCLPILGAKGSGFVTGYPLSFRPPLQPPLQPRMRPSSVIARNGAARRGYHLHISSEQA